MAGRLPIIKVLLGPRVGLLGLETISENNITVGRLRGSPAPSSNTDPERQESPVPV